MFLNMDCGSIKSKNNIKKRKIDKYADKRLNLEAFAETLVKPPIYKILNPYNKEKAIDSIKTLTEDSIFQMKKKRFEFEYNNDSSSYKNSFTNIKICSKKINKNSQTKYITIHNFFDILNDSGEKYELIIDFYKSQITLFRTTDLSTISPYFSRIYGKETFNKVKELLTEKTSKLGSFTLKLSINFRFENIEKIIVINQEMYLFELKHPPEWKTNFLKLSEEDNSLEFTPSNFFFQAEFNIFSQLKYKDFVLIVENDRKTDNVFNSQLNSIPGIKIIEDGNHIDIIKEDKKVKEINEFFITVKFNNIFKETLFEIFYDFLIIISESILPYFNVISICEKLEENQRFFEEKLSISNLDNHKLHLALTYLIERQKNRSYLNNPSFLLILKETYNTLSSIKQYKNLNKFYLSKRIIATPTLYLFSPNTEDSGNRLIREYLTSPSNALRITFKNDYLNEEAKWLNLLMEYKMIILNKGITILDKHYKFLGYSQSQFRIQSCWLAVNPEEIIAKSGNFQKLKTVSKKGARIGQILTTTKQTINMYQFKENIHTNIPDVTHNDFVFSDGVSILSNDIAKIISESLKLKHVPSAFQARFLGCKGVWSVKEEEKKSTFIYLRASQIKFEKEISEKEYFEVCDYAKFNKCFLNRQVILLLNTLGVDDDIFEKMFNNFLLKLQNIKLIVQLINNGSIRNVFNCMIDSGISSKDDRLLSAVLNSNKEILLKDLKDKCRIYVEKGACLMGIMDEYNVLEYGEAFCKIDMNNDNQNIIILDQKAAVTKCPCLYPGDIRVLNFKKYKDENTKKYKILENYTNVIVFPQRGKRPHPNEISGSDLDGDMYFILYDEDIVKRIKEIEPMNYNFPENKESQKPIVELKDICKFFCEYASFNTVGLIADAHLAISCFSRKKAFEEKAIKLALMFPEAVDAPKTGKKVLISKKDMPEVYPLFMYKANSKKTYRNSNNILDKLYLKMNDYLESYNQITEKLELYDKGFIIKPGYEVFLFEALINYTEYYEEIIGLMKIYGIQSESELLTGNNDEYTGFQKKKHNYDVKEFIESKLNELFEKYNEKFINPCQNLGIDRDFDTLFKCHIVERSEAHYIITYNFNDYFNEFKNIKIDQILGEFYNLIEGFYEYSNDSDYFPYSIRNLDNDFMEFNTNYEEYITINHTINCIKQRLENCLKKMNFFISSNVNYINILSLPWILSSSKILINLKKYS